MSMFLNSKAVDDSIEDSLEFYIKFPSANSSSSMPAVPSGMGDAEQFDSIAEPCYESNDFVFVYNEHANTPIILLLGWAGCQDKYLQKYSKIYEDRG